MALRILTADEVKAKITKTLAENRKEQRDFERRRAKLEASMDLRDDVCSIILNSGFHPEQIHAKGGPTVVTIGKWMDKKVLQPRVGKMRSALRICGYDLAIVDKSGNRVLTKRGA